jgi:hypothetical protein
LFAAVRPGDMMAVFALMAIVTVVAMLTMTVLLARLVIAAVMGPPFFAVGRMVRCRLSGRLVGSPVGGRNLQADQALDIAQKGAFLIVAEGILGRS